VKINRRKLLSLLGVSPAILAGPAAAGDQKHKAPPAATEVKFEGVNPHGMPPAIQLVPMAPRLPSLENKTIYLISDGFPGADHFLDQISIWFKKSMPSVTTQYRLKKGGFADDDPALWAEIKDKGNAVIMAIGHSSTCTPATVGHCANLEKLGIPTAPMVTIAFKDLATSTAAKRGMPHERICFTAHPIWGKSDEQMYAYLEGNDPVTGKPLMPEVIAALTNPRIAQSESVRGFRGTVLSVRDVSEQEKFLTEAIGFRKTGVDGAYHRFEIGSGGANKTLTLLHEPDRAPGSWTFGAGTVHHLALWVANDDAPAAQKAIYEELGYTDASEIKDRFYFHSMYVRSPGGILVECCCNVPGGFEKDEKASELGTKLHLPPWFEERRKEILGTLEAIMAPAGSTSRN
jgi:hypothetical protein